MDLYKEDFKYSDYIVLTLDGVRMVFAIGGPGRHSVVMTEDGVVKKIQKFGKSKCLSLIDYYTVIQVKIDDVWEVVNKRCVLTSKGVLENDLRHGMILKKSHIRFSKYDGNGNRKALTTNKFNRDITTLRIVSNQSGGFYKAHKNGVRISKDDLFKILGIDGYRGFTLEYHIDNFKEKNRDFHVIEEEIDVS